MGEHYDNAKEGKIRQYLNPIFGFVPADNLSDRRVMHMDVDINGGFDKLKEDKIWTEWSEELRGDSTGLMDSLNKSSREDEFASLVKNMFEMVKENFEITKGTVVAIQKLSQQPTVGSQTKSEGSVDDRATAELVKHTEWSNIQIAEAVVCHPKTLSNKKRCPRFCAAKKAYKGNPPPRGHKNSDGQLEAYDEE